MSKDTLEVIDSADVKQINEEFYQLGSRLVPDLREPDLNNLYTKAEIDQVRKALDKASFGAEFGAGDGNSPRDVLIESLLFNANGGNPSASEKTEMNKLIDQAGTNMKALDIIVDTLTEQVANTPKGEPQYITEMVLEKPIPKDVRDSVEQIKENLVGIIKSIGSDANIPLPGEINGIPDDQFFKSYQATLAYVTDEAILIDKTENYTPALRETNLESQLRLRVKIEGGNTGQVTELFDDLDVVYKAGFLDKPINMVEKKTLVASSEVISLNIPNVSSSSPVTPSENVNPTPPSTTGEQKTEGGKVADSSKGKVVDDSKKLTKEERTAKESLDDAKTAIGNLLYSIGDLKDIPGIGKVISKLGGADDIYTPLTKEQANDGKFGDHEQDLMSKLIMLLKTIDGQEGADGRYSKSIGNNLQLSILTKKEFSFIRDMEGVNVDFYGDSKENIALAKALLKFEPMDKPEEGASAEKQAKYAQNQEFQNKYKEELASVGRLNIIFDSMDVLAKTKTYDNKKAAEVTRNNIMMDLFASKIDDWMPGLKGWMKGFFESDLGQMVGDILNVFFGIDVKRLWGEKSEPDSIATGIKRIGDKFEKRIDDVAKANPNMAFSKQMELVTQGVLDDKDGIIKQAALTLALGAENNKILNAAIEAALEEAEATDNKEQAKTVFLTKLEEIGHAFKTGKEISINGQIFNKAERTDEDIRSDADALVKELNNKGVDLAAVASAASAASATDNKSENKPQEEQAKTVTEPTADMDVIKVGEKVSVGLVFTPNTTDYPKDMRLSNGRVDDIQAGLSELNLSVITPEMIKINGKFSDMATPRTSAMLEESLIRAQLHDFKVNNPDKDITKEDIDGFSHKLTTENLPTLLPMLEAYMKADGVSDDSVRAVSENLTKLANDYYSTGLDGNPKRDTSVLDQSFLGKQISAHMFAPEAKIEAPIIKDVPEEIDPDYQRYLDYNKDRPCDIPMFFTKEGSDSAFVAMIDKNGTPDDTSDDEFKIHEIKGYVAKDSVRSIHDSRIVTDLQENYKWTNGSKHGIETFIDKVLCLEEVNLVVDIPPPKLKEEKPETTTTLFNSNAMGCSYDKNPESFSDLCTFTNTQAAIIKERGLDVYAMAQEAFRSSPNSEYVIIDLAKFDIKGEELPDAIAIRSFGDQYIKDMDARAIDYDAANIKPLADQYRDGYADMAQKHTSPYGGRHLDTVMSIYKIHSGGKITQGAVQGYPIIMAVVPNDKGDGAMVQNAMQSVYGEKGITSKAMTEYSSGQYSRWSSRTGYLKAMENSALSGTSEGHESIIRNAGQSPTDEIAVQENKSGSIRGFFNNLLGDDDPKNTETKIEQNTNDMGVSNDECEFGDFNWECDASVVANKAQQHGVGAR